MDNPEYEENKCKVDVRNGISNREPSIELQIGKSHPYQVIMLPKGTVHSNICSTKPERQLRGEGVVVQEGFTQIDYYLDDKRPFALVEKLAKLGLQYLEDNDMKVGAVMYEEMSGYNKLQEIIAKYTPNKEGAL
tara:strand:+ start:188 stop:589 length:402 start_codon:yes stop_codon:yes gene_type:complete